MPTTTSRLLCKAVSLGLSENERALIPAPLLAQLAIGGYLTLTPSDRRRLPKTTLALLAIGGFIELTRYERDSFNLHTLAMLALSSRVELKDSELVRLSADLRTVVKNRMIKQGQDSVPIMGPGHVLSTAGIWRCFGRMIQQTGLGLLFPFPTLIKRQSSNVAAIMNRNHKSLGTVWCIGFTVVFLSILSVPVRACTIFVLTDAKRALFCNNEDWTNPKTRIWFIPACNGHYGCAYVGFDDGRAQGGLNTKGLAYDWVAGSEEPYKPDPNLQPIRGNGSSCQQLLETCATIEDAIAFYQTHQEASLSRAKILVADKTGASVIIGAQNGQLVIQQEDRCRGFGYGERTLDKMLAPKPEPTVANGFKILRQLAEGCHQILQHLRSEIRRYFPVSISRPG